MLPNATKWCHIEFPSAWLLFMSGVYFISPMTWGCLGFYTQSPLVVTLYFFLSPFHLSSLGCLSRTIMKPLVVFGIQTASNSVVFFPLLSFGHLISGPGYWELPSLGIVFHLLTSSLLDASRTFHPCCHLVVINGLFLSFPYLGSSFLITNKQ